MTRTRHRRMPRRRRRRGLRRGALLPGALLASAALAAPALWQLLPEQTLPDVGAYLGATEFRLRGVDFLGLRALSASELIESTALEVGTPLVDVDPDGVCDALRAHTRVAECSAARIPPRRLIVEIVERTPVAVVGDGRTAIAAGGGRFALAPGEGAGLPRVDGEAEQALAWILAARDADLPLAHVEARGPSDLILRLASEDVRIRVSGDPGRAIRDWKRLARSGLVERLSAGEVDLRFRGTAVLRELRHNQGRGNEDGSS